MTTITPAPTAKGRPILGYTREFQASPLGAMGDLFDEFGDLIHFRFFGPFYGYLMRHPDHFQHILQENPRNYTKIPAPSFVILQPSIGNGLLTSDGDFWLRQRRLAQPAFHRKRIAEFGRIMTEAMAKQIALWQKMPKDRPIDVAEAMHDVTLEIVGKTLFDVDLSAEAERIGRAVSHLSEYTAQQTLDPFSLYKLRIPFWPSTKKLMDEIRILDEVVYKIIAERHIDPRDHGDLLSMFMLTRDEDTGEKMSDKQLRDEVMTMMLAGHETTAVTLSWSLYLLAKHPEIFGRLQQEVETVLQGRTPTMDDVPQLVYTNQVIQEVMRLYPPAYAMARWGNQPDKIAGYDLPKNASITMSTYHLHRHPDFWPDPEKFDPERFSKENSAGRSRFAYLPFGAGPRQCIGNIFAMTEAILMLPMMVQNFRFTLPQGYVAELEPLITLRPKNGLPLYLETVKPMVAVG